MGAGGGSYRGGFGVGAGATGCAGCGIDGRAASSAATRAFEGSAADMGIVPANGRLFVAGAGVGVLTRCASGIVLLSSCFGAPDGIASVPFMSSIGSFMSTLVAISTGSSSTCAAARFKSVQNAPTSG
jgi:hypothetical protein